MNNKKSKPSRRERSISRGIKALNNESPNKVKVKTIEWGEGWSLANPKSLIGSDVFDPINNLLNNPHFLYKVVESNATVSAAIEKVASSFSKFPLKLYQRDRDNVLRPVKGTAHTEHKLKKPNFEDSEFNFKYRICLSLMIEGGVYLVKSGGVFVVAPRDMRYDSEKNKYFMFGGSTPLNPSQVIKIGKPDGSLKYGSSKFFSPLRAALSEILLNSRIVLHSNNHLQNGAMIRGIIKSKDQFSTQQQIDDVAEDFQSKSSGLDSSSTIALPPNYDFVPLQMTAAETGLIPLFDLTKSSIIQAIGVPEGLLKNDYSSYNAATAQKQFFNETTIGPLLDMAEDAFNSWPELTSDNQYFQFDRTGIVSPEEKRHLAEAKDKEMSAVLKMKTAGIFSANEMRIASSYDKILDIDGDLVDEADENPFVENGLINDPVLTQPEETQTTADEVEEIEEDS